MAARPVLAIAFAAALAAAGALAAQPAAEPPADPSAETSARPRLVCRGATKTVGSRIRTARRCRTAEQWQDEDDVKGRLPIGAQITEGQNGGRAPVQPR
jgi:hypothetical protein